MALRAQITGAIAEPVLRWTPKQQAVLDLRINATASVKNESTRQWEAVGDPLWVSISFWDQNAQHYNEILGKGDRVTVEGTLVLENYQKRDGTQGSNLSLRSPRLLGVIPKRGGSGQAEPAATTGAISYNPPTDDPWGTPAEQADAPF